MNADEAFDRRSVRLAAERTHFEQHVLHHDALDRLEAKERAMREEIETNSYLQMLTLTDEVKDAILDRPDAADLLDKQADELQRLAWEERERVLEQIDPAFVVTEWGEPEEGPYPAPPDRLGRM